jgi:hypothetical protein
MRPKLNTKRRTGAAKARWGWSGVAAIIQPSLSDEQIRSLTILLPSRQSSLEQIVAKIIYFGGKYRRYLHQDEFGPTRAEQMAALRTLMDQLNLVRTQLTNLSENIRLRLSDELSCQESRPSCSWLDDAILEQLYEAAIDLERGLRHENAPQDARAVGELGQLALNAYMFLTAIDTNTPAKFLVGSIRWSPSMKR